MKLRQHRRYLDISAHEIMNFSFPSLTFPSRFLASILERRRCRRLAIDDQEVNFYLLVFSRTSPDLKREKAVKVVLHRLK